MVLCTRFDCWLRFIRDSADRQINRDRLVPIGGCKRDRLVGVAPTSKRIGCDIGNSLTVGQNRNDNVGCWRFGQFQRVAIGRACGNDGIAPGLGHDHFALVVVKDTHVNFGRVSNIGPRRLGCICGIERDSQGLTFAIFFDRVIDGGDRHVDARHIVGSCEAHVELAIIDVGVGPIGTRDGEIPVRVCDFVDDIFAAVRDARQR